MKDALGKELQVGDKVVFVYGANANSRLMIGTVNKIYVTKSYNHEEECTVNASAHVRSFRVMKLDEELLKWEGED